MSHARSSLKCDDPSPKKITLRICERRKWGVMEVGQTIRSIIDRPLYTADNKFIAFSYVKETK